VHDFHGRVALITSIGGGIGAPLPAGFAGEGALVVAVDIHGDAAKATASSIGNGATAARVDVTDPAAVEQLATQVFEQNGVGTQPSFREQIINRFEALPDCRIPGPVVAD
jgi:NAD(P)-dependent dehydrogenase (short-subunit alcohol dehydrogenase family)